MKFNIKTFIICIAIPLLTGFLSSVISGNNMSTYKQLNKAPLSPPGIVFPIVWTILFILMGIASYLIVTSGKGKEQIQYALEFYGLQLIVNFWWSIFFFRFDLYFFAFLLLLILWLLIYFTIKAFYEVKPLAAYLLIPYLLWVTFAGYLNFAIFLLN